MTRSSAHRALVLFLSCAPALGGCGSDATNAPGGTGADGITFPPVGPLSGDSGKAGFRFGAASAATQIEDRNPDTDWHLWTEPTANGGLGKGAAFVGDAADGYTKALDDVALLEKLHVDSYRFSMEWARIEPTRGAIDEAALQHYGEVLDTLVKAHVKPNVTVHHFSNPVWIDDPRDPDCQKSGPDDSNLCGLGHPTGGPMVVKEMADFARLLAQRFGDRVDDWATLNEPVNYLLASYGIGTFPPGKTKLFTMPEFMAVVRDYLAAHAAMYAAIKEADTIDADGDGIAANVGMTLSVVKWEAARDNQPSTDPEDTGALDRLTYAFHHLAPDSLTKGTFDFDLDGKAEESHPDWANTLDWLGLQYYMRAGVTGKGGLIPVLALTPCFSGVDSGACLPAKDPSFCVPTMKYETYPPGLYDVLADFKDRYPALPLVVTEAGIATDVGERRAENVVRILEQIDRARKDGVDVRGYYHWSLYDNFEWTNGFDPHFGLYKVDYAGSYDRTPTAGADVFSEIVKNRVLSNDARKRYGGDGPMAAEGAPPANGLCNAP